MNSRRRRLADSAILGAVSLWAWLRYPRLSWWYLRRSLAKGHSWPRLGLPRSVNDRFFWRKVFDHDPRFVILSDKLACKDWVRERMPDLPMARVLWQGTDARQIPEDVLAGDVIVKASHGCAMQVMIRGGQHDRADLTEKADRWMRRRHGRRRHEWAYSQVPHRLLVEEWLAPGQPLEELKVYVYGNEVLCVVHIIDRIGNDSATVWSRAPGEDFLEGTKSVISDRMTNRPLPGFTDRAIEIAIALAHDFDHLRVDFLSDGSTLWIGELTVYNLSGEIHDIGPDPQSLVARLWDLRRSWFLSNPPRHGWRGVYARALLRRLNERQET